MKKFITFILLAVFPALAFSIPAKRGLWRTLTLKDGTTVTAQLKGDENAHYYQTATGDKYVAGADGFYELTTAETISQRAVARRTSAANRRNIRRAKRKNVGGAGKVYSGEKKGLIILVEFSDVSFSASNDKTLYTRIANEEGFTSSEGFVGSVADYFKAQSGGIFQLTFDVVGPVKLSKSYSYYGANDSEGYDKYVGAMAAEACKAVVDSVNFADYDWDGDDEVDQVFILYAGHGEASYDQDPNTVWPHEWDLESSDYGKSLTLDGVKINTYACSSELGATEAIDGIGTICHEFSHCLGFPDMYDTNYENFGMCTWDLMDYGSYNGDGFVPAGYTSYEKMVAGWLTPIELKEDTQVIGQKALSEGGDAYIIYNDNHQEEFYMLENRQKTSWDAELDGAGLLILHVDYDEDVWTNNEVNTTSSRQRCTIFHADNADGTSVRDVSRDTYPYNGNDSLTNTSKPKASVYNKNTDGSYLMNKAVYAITQNDDGTVSYNFRLDETSESTSVVTGDTIFYESFDQCSGTGGNDGKWSGQIASSTSDFKPDNEGWESAKSYGGNQCARFGSSKASGVVTSPTIKLGTEGVLSFRVGIWDSKKDGSSIDVYVNGNLNDVYTIERGKWTDITIQLESSATVVLKIIPTKRIFLDEVVVTKKEDTSGIKLLSNGSKMVSDRIYSLDGRYVGRDFSKLKSGIYIKNGKKIVK